MVSFRYILYSKKLLWLVTFFSILIFIYFYLNNYLDIHDASEQTHGFTDDDRSVELDFDYAIYWPQISQYCNPVDNMIKQERELPKKYRLYAVSAVIRHGERTPLSLSKSLYEGSNNLLCNAEHEDFIPIIKTLEETFKHSLPQKLKMHSWYANKDKCNSAQLTRAGTWQLFALGKQISSQYSSLVSYLADWTNNKTSNTTLKGKGGFVYMRTTEYERTFQSGVAFLAGLFNETLNSFYSNTHEGTIANQHIHDRFTTTNNDKNIKPNKKMSDFLQEILKISSTSYVNQCTEEGYTDHGMEPPSCSCPQIFRMEKLQRKQLSLKQNEKNLINKGKKTVMDFYGQSFSLGSSLESISSFICNGHQLPCLNNAALEYGKRRSQNLNPSCLKWSDVGSIIKAINATEVADSRNDFQRLRSYLQAYPLMWEIWYKLSLSTLYDRIEEEKKPRIMIYLGHDTTILPLLDLLGIKRNLWWQSFASSIIFELYSVRSKQFYIRILYDGVDVTTSLPFCTGPYVTRDGLCLFENLSFFIVKDLQTRSNKKSYNEFCHS